MMRVSGIGWKVTMDIERDCVCLSEVVGESFLLFYSFCIPLSSLPRHSFCYFLQRSFLHHRGAVET